ncbi:MAG TPA: ABC transporter permease subunit [candidate division Zixibacteria bacterium]|nr:ABC transporter permease subunit [candidate division Zixibacteria bacterium]
MKQDKQPRPKRRTWLLVAVVVIVVMIYAYAIQKTNVNLEEPLDPNRQEELASLIRDLAHPDFFTYDSETRTTNISIRMPCQEVVQASEVAGEGRALRLDPNCVSTTQDPITASGTGFIPNTDGVILWFPISQSEFHIERSIDGDTWGEIDAISADSTSYFDSDLVCGSTYYYRLRTFRAIDDQFSPYSDEVSNRTEECGLSEPFGLSAIRQSQDSIELAWQGLPQENGETSIERKTFDDVWTEIARVPSGTGEYLDERLSCDTSYEYRIREIRDPDRQSSRFSNIAADSTISCEKDAPADLLAQAISQSQIDLEWSGNQENESAYLIERSPDGLDWQEIGEVLADSTSYSDPGLGCEAEYFYRVRGFQETNEQYSQYSQLVSDTTEQCGLPTPTNLTGFGVSQFQADLKWESNTDEEAPFSVERLSESGEWTEIGFSRFGNSSFEDDDLICGSSYNYRVRANQSEGELLSPYSNEMTAETFACTKEPPENVNALTVSQSDIDLSWQDVSIFETISRELSEFKTGDDGDFSVTFTMPDVREHDEPQRIAVVEIISRRITGLSDTSQETLKLIVVTILMALMASTLGSLLAIPISFLGARNLMADIGAPLAAIMAAIIGLAIGGFAGLFLGRQISSLVGRITENAWVGLAALAIVFSVAGLLMKFAVPTESEKSPRSTWINSTVTLVILLSLILGLGFLAVFGLTAGDWMRANLGFFGFIGNFIAVLSELVTVFLSLMVALAGGLLGASYSSRYGQEAVLRLSVTPAKIVTALLTLLGTSAFFFGLIYFVNWICLFGVCDRFPDETPELYISIATLAVPLGIIAGLLSLAVNPKRPYPIGMLTYAVTRTLLNALRAIEPVILGFTFVVWVGIGPFAGVMALMLNSIADLGKLFSEQVENISEGPVEAVTATGANRLQVIVFSVVPQVVPHFIAFIFYRWDINVRMSTIIGFVGGGGIGVVLFRYTNQTLYQKAAVMVIAIAVVVTLLDYISSRIRKRVI